MRSRYNIRQRRRRRRPEVRVVDGLQTNSDPHRRPIPCARVRSVQHPKGFCHLFSDINNSQGSVATRLRCGGIFSYRVTENLSLSRTTTEF